MSAEPRGCLAGCKMYFGLMWWLYSTCVELCLAYYCCNPTVHVVKLHTNHAIVITVGMLSKMHNLYGAAWAYNNKHGPGISVMFWEPDKQRAQDMATRTCLQLQDDIGVHCIEYVDRQITTCRYSEFTDVP